MARTGAGRRYAEAAFQLAERDGAVDAWLRDLVLAAGLARDERVSRAVDSPAVPFSARRKAVEQLMGKLGADERPVIGEKANTVRDTITDALTTRRAALARLATVVS